MFRAVESLKDYAMKALINTVDHLGSVAFKVNSLLDEKIGEVSETELRFACLEQVYYYTFCFLSKSFFSVLVAFRISEIRKLLLTLESKIVSSIHQPSRHISTLINDNYSQAP